MKNQSKLPAVKKKRDVMEEMWLQYFNSALLNRGVISEDEYRRMKTKIISHAVNHNLP